MKKQNEWLEKRIKDLTNTPARNALRASSAKQRFLAEAKNLQTVSNQQNTRHNHWKTIFLQKETFPMKLAILVTILTMLFGGSGATLVAAQSSLPNETLYPVKVWAEDLRLGLTANPETAFELNVQFANQRYEEIQTLIEEGLMPPTPALYRWEYQWQHALELAAETSDPTSNIVKVQQQLRQQARLMNETRPDETFEPLMSQFQNRIQQQLELSELGLQDAQMMKQMLQQRLQQLDDQQLIDSEYALQWQHRIQNPLNGQMNQSMNSNQNTADCPDCSGIPPQDQTKNKDGNAEECVEDCAKNQYQEQEQYQTENQNQGENQPGGPNTPNESNGPNGTQNGQSNGSQNSAGNGTSKSPGSGGK